MADGKFDIFLSDYRNPSLYFFFPVLECRGNAIAIFLLLFEQMETRQSYLRSRLFYPSMVTSDNPENV